MLHIGNKFHLIVLGLVLALAGFFRFWAVPLSAGPDIAQFWAFAKVFQLHGLDFYQYADGTGAIFPFQGWRFVYPPIWLLISKWALMASPTSSATTYMVDIGWRLAEKTPIILADLAIGILLYWVTPGSKSRKLLFASLWLFNPAVWYQSAVFGQFDAIAAAFLLVSIIMLERGKDRWAFLAAGLAVMTKQHTFIPVALMVAISARNMDKRRLLTNCSILAGVVILMSIPFLITGNFSSYARSLFLPGGRPDYQNPLSYAFSGTGALLTYLHNVFDWNTSGLLQLNIPLLVIALIAALVFSYRRSVTPAQGALIGFLIFLSFSYRVNYQYLVVYIPIAILLASRTQYRSEKALAIVLTLLPGVWLWFFDVSYWFNSLSPVNPWVTPIFARVGLAHRGMPDYAYVILALVLMSLFLTYVVCTFLRWRHPAIR